MATYIVWHSNKPVFFNNTDTLKAFPEGFTPVAEVTTDDVGRVFELTNNIHSSWVLNPGVRVRPEGKTLMKLQCGLRSTSVGDIITVPGQQRWFIDVVGLREF